MRSATTIARSRATTSSRRIKPTATTRLGMVAEHRERVYGSGLLYPNGGIAHNGRRRARR